MRKRIKPWNLLLIFLFLFGPFLLKGNAETPNIFWENEGEDSLVQTILAQMTDEEVLGQVFLLGYSGSSPSKEIMEWIRTRNIGGVKIFGWNAGNLQKLTSSISLMQKTAGSTRNAIPLLIATDQEGGWVRHIKGDTSITPGNMAIGASGITYDAFNTGYFIGLELAGLGINMNFAPDVDIYTNKAEEVIGPRAFSDDPVTTSILSVAYFKGMEQAGVICTAKHFPGHGDADKDSHGALPRIYISFDTLWNRELLPYRFLIKENIPAIMSGHLAFPEILDNNTPASLSGFFQNEVLRKKLGYTGITLTDDLMMGGALDNELTLPEVCLKALNAGNDMIMLSRTPGLNDAIWQLLYKNYKEDPAFQERITESVKRILKLKIKYLKEGFGVPLYPDDPANTPGIPSTLGKSFFFDSACRSVTIVKGDSIPLTNQEKNGRILLAGQYDVFLKQGEVRFPGAKKYYFPYAPFNWAERDELKYLKKKADEYDVIIFCLANPNSLEVLKTLKGTKAKVIVLSVLTPIYLKEVPWISSAIAVYGTGEESFSAGFSVLSGDYTPEGKLPFSFFNQEE